MTSFPSSPHSLIAHSARESQETLGCLPILLHIYTTTHIETLFLSFSEYKLLVCNLNDDFFLFIYISMSMRRNGCLLLLFLGVKYKNKYVSQGGGPLYNNNKISFLDPDTTI